MYSRHTVTAHKLLVKGVGRWVPAGLWRSEGLTYFTCFAYTTYLPLCRSWVVTDTLPSDIASSSTASCETALFQIFCVEVVLNLSDLHFTKIEYWDSARLELPEEQCSGAATEVLSKIPSLCDAPFQYCHAKRDVNLLSKAPPFLMYTIMYDDSNRRNRLSTC